MSKDQKSNSDKLSNHISPFLNVKQLQDSELQQNQMMKLNGLQQFQQNHMSNLNNALLQQSNSLDKKGQNDKGILFQNLQKQSDQNYQQVQNPAFQNGPLYVVKGGEYVQQGQYYFSPQMLKQAQQQKQQQELSAQPNNQSNDPNDSQQQSLNDPSKDSIYSNSVFKKKANHFATLNPMQRFFEQDLNLKYQEDRSKFIGKFSSPDETYTIQRLFVQTTDPSIKLYYSKFIPSSNIAKKGSLLVVHGFYEHSGLYINFADFFVRLGYEVHLYDQRGYGYTGGITRNCSMEEFQRDFKFILKLVDQSIPLFIHAHSTGVLSVLTYLIFNQSQKISGLIAMNSFVEVPSHYGMSKMKIWICKLFLKLNKELLVNSKINMSALCKNSYHIKKIIKDEHVSPYLTMRMAVSIIDMCQIINDRANEIMIPIYIIHGKDDVIIEPHNSQKLFTLISSKDKEIHILEGGFHQPLLDTNAQEVHNIILNWISSRISFLYPKTDNSMENWEKKTVIHRNRKMDHKAYVLIWMLGLMAFVFKKRGLYILAYLVDRKVKYLQNALEII